MAQGYLWMQENGRYAVDGDELTAGRGIEVEIGGKWLPMRIEHDGEEYYLLCEALSFYPKRVYVRC